MGRAETIYRRTLADIRNIVQDYETDDQFCMSDFSIEPGEAVSKREMTMIQNMLNKDYEKLQWNHKRGFVDDNEYMFKSKIYDAMQRTIDKARHYHLGEAYTNASLMNVRNQLMNKLGADFDVMGGSTTPKIIITPDKYKNIQFEIQENGQGVEVMPVINSIPDYLHKRKGIAFMQAANVLYDFIMDTLSSVKKEGVNMINKLTINESSGRNEYFVGVFTKDQLDKYDDERQYEDFKTFTDRQSAWDYALKWNMKGYCIAWASSEIVGYGYAGDNDYYEEEETNEYDYGPYEMEKYTNAFHEEYNRDIFTPRALTNLVSIGYTDEGDYYIKHYNDCIIQVSKDQGSVDAYDKGWNKIYCPIKRVQSEEEIEELDMWGE